MKTADRDILLLQRLSSGFVFYCSRALDTECVLIMARANPLGRSSWIFSGYASCTSYYPKGIKIEK